MGGQIAAHSNVHVTGAPCGAPCAVLLTGAPANLSRTNSGQTPDALIANLSRTNSGQTPDALTANLSRTNSGQTVLTGAPCGAPCAVLLTRLHVAHPVPLTRLRVMVATCKIPSFGSLALGRWYPQLQRK